MMQKKAEILWNQNKCVFEVIFVEQICRNIRLDMCVRVFPSL